MRRRKSAMHEHLVEGFRATAAPHEVDGREGPTSPCGRLYNGAGLGRKIVRIGS
jgi:hypothetical protein